MDDTEAVLFADGSLLLGNAEGYPVNNAYGMFEGPGVSTEALGIADITTVDRDGIIEEFINGIAVIGTTDMGDMDGPAEVAVDGILEGTADGDTVDDADGMLEGSYIIGSRL
jgi:hypothetical protein